jgi:hypothetical protein
VNLDHYFSKKYFDVIWSMVFLQNGKKNPTIKNDGATYIEATSKKN